MRSVFVLTLSLSLLSLLATGCPDTPASGDTTASDADSSVDVNPADGDVGSDAEADTGADVAADTKTPCSCGQRVCGVAPPGDPPGCKQLSCGECTGAAESCNPDGQCIVKGAVNGAWCGLTADCPGLVPDPTDPSSTIVNPDLATCLDQQCQSDLCLTTPSGGKFVTNMPACTKACSVKKDDNSDGVEDADAVGSDCTGFVTDGPAGDVDWTCVQFSGPDAGDQVAMCMPRASFEPCDRDADCSNGEHCTFTSVHGALLTKCQAPPVAGAWGTVGESGDLCTEDDGDLGEAAYCAAGWCLNVCASYCSTDADCDNAAAGACAAGKCDNYPDRDCAVDSDCSTSECIEEGIKLFSDQSGIPPQLLCLPLGCEIDTDCAQGSYCDRAGADLQADGTLVMTKRCEPAYSAGAALGASCDEDNGCKNSNHCIDGYCSAYCADATQCTTDQLCVVDDTIFLVEDGPPVVLQTGTVERCESFPGDGGPCASQMECDTYATNSSLGEHHCALFALNQADVDAPMTLASKCVPSVGTQPFGTLCSKDVQCASGICLGSDFCSLVCTSYSDCPNPEDQDGQILTGYCRAAPVAFGGDFNDETTNVYAGLCFFTEAKGGDCSADFKCPDGEACAPLVLAKDPTQAATVDFMCLSNTNADGSAGTKTMGEACDPEAVDANGVSVTECASGLCFVDEVAADGSAYCSQLCTATADCTGTLECIDKVLYERKGAYTANEGGYMACQVPGS